MRICGKLENPPKILVFFVTLKASPSSCWFYSRKVGLYALSLATQNNRKMTRMISIFCLVAVVLVFAWVSLFFFARIGSKRILEYRCQVIGSRCGWLHLRGYCPSSACREVGLYLSLQLDTCELVRFVWSAWIPRQRGTAFLLDEDSGPGTRVLARPSDV